MESPVLSRGPAHGVPSAQLRIPEAAFALSGASKHQTATEHHDAITGKQLSAFIQHRVDEERKLKEELHGRAGAL